MAKEPAWRALSERPDHLLKPYNGRGLSRPVPIPSYVQRWLVVTSHHRKRHDGPEDMAAAMLTDACTSYFRLHAPPLPFALRSGRTIDPPRRDPETLREIEQQTGDGAAVLNGAFVWFFALPAAADVQERFSAWVKGAWYIKPAAIKRAGWPVMVLPRGEWPIDPRLIPGTPVALPELIHQL